MNKIYALVWNPVRECWNVVNEHCSRRSKGNSKRRLAAALSLLSLLPLEQALALPSGQNIVSGKGDITTNGPDMTINQHSDKLITQWDSFNVGGNESVTFRQPGDTSVALNRVIGVNGSDIQGKINANGKVFIVNPNGVIFGKNAQVNVGGWWLRLAISVMPTSWREKTVSSAVRKRKLLTKAGYKRLTQAALRYWAHG
ncbi:two-partner secretion domain-containing protein [Serratia marcescens]|uniref:two-partner secretion domain-containing protein n=1 Tax=Serratia marcescens TaxID=615 RepID=UPI001F20ABA2|nr:filamentous hemagglutinin N-terminal domain-containing protein [Serratia marcescens]